MNGCSHPASRHKAADGIWPVPNQRLPDRVSFAGDDRVVRDTYPILMPLRMPRYRHVVAIRFDLPIGARSVAKIAELAALCTIVPLAHIRLSIPPLSLDI